MSSAIKQAITSMTANAKQSDLAQNTVEVSKSTKLTTDHGVPVSDTDNWCVANLTPSTAC